MPCLPSGAHYCLDCGPLDELIKSARIGQRIPELRRVRRIDDLRPYQRFLWLRPIGADCALDKLLNEGSLPVPDGYALVDSGHTLQQLPDELDAVDRAAIEEFWQSRRCGVFLVEQFWRVVRALKEIAQADRDLDDPGCRQT